MKTSQFFTLGIMPYISVSIIIQFMTPVIPALEALKKEGASGQRIITRYTRQGTIILALFQGSLIATGLESQGLALDPGWVFRVSTVVTLTAGTAFIMWLGEQITERGIGNGISIIIVAGIVARMPQVLAETIALSRTGEIDPLALLGLLAFCVATIIAIVYVERSYRKVPVQYPRRMVGKNLAQSQTQYLPLKLNMAGVIPPIFAYAFFALPATVVQFTNSEILQDLMTYLVPPNPVYIVVFVTLIVFFCYYYTAIVYNPVEVADNLKKNGGFVPTVRPGKQTADYLYGVLNRLTFWGAIYISLVCIIPELFYMNMGVTSFSYVFGGTAILISVSVVLDTASQIESHVVAQNYEAFMNKSSKGGRGGMGSMRQARTRILKR